MPRLLLLLAAASSLALPRPTPPRLSRRALLVGSSSLPVLFTVAPLAEAAFGPAGGSLDSPPKLKAIDVEAWLDLRPEKAKQRAGAVPLSRLRAIREQIDQAFSSESLESLIAALEAEAPTPAIAAELLALRERLRRGADARRLARELREREEQLARLAAQPPLVVYGAAFAASCASTAVMHPLDTYKTLQQSGRLPSAFPPLASLYAGLLPNLLKEGPSSALYLGVYEAAKARLLASPLGAAPLAVYLAAGACGEVAGSVVRAPAEAAKARLQANLSSDAAGALRGAVGDAAGRRRTARAWGASLLRDVPMGGAQLAVFESLKAAAVASAAVRWDTNSPAAEALFGAAGGLVGALITAPADVIVTRINTQLSSDNPAGLWEVTRQIWEEEGLGGFFAGATSRVLYWAPAIGIFLSLYCTLRQLAL
ncbi:hypothetical protein AB1Y20_016500 [Prymnesium parvum]|uniref:Mitochondrial carrier protein n=1 Tax=Prymnesium parvum TaxID=97485 RepID=A0AB34IDY3_PRYPA